MNDGFGRGLEDHSPIRRQQFTRIPVPEGHPLSQNEALLCLATEHMAHQCLEEGEEEISLELPLSSSPSPPKDPQSLTYSSHLPARVDQRKVPGWRFLLCLLT